MKAYLLRNHGGPGVLKISEVDNPKIKPGHIKIKPKILGLNYAEILSRKGQYNWAPRKPYIPGMEGFGQVTEVGEGCAKFKTGDKVIFGTKYGAYAEEIVISEHMAFDCIEGYSEEENAAFLVNFMTAWIAMFNMGRIRPEDIVLIQAAAGGVGIAAVQLAKKFGCKVYGTAGNNEKLELLRELGVDEAINYRHEDFYETIRAKEKGVDFVLEVVGGDVFKKSIALLNPFGRLIVTGYASIPLQRWNPWAWWLTWKHAPKVNIMKMAEHSYGVLASHIGYLIEDREIVEKTWSDLTDFVQKHKIKPVIGKVYNFEQMPEAHAFIESRQSVGKVLVKIV